MQASAPRRWHVNLVLFCFDGGQVPQRCLISKFMSSNWMLWPFIASARTTRANPFWLSQSSRNFNSEQRSTRFIILDKMLWPFTTSAHTTRCMPFLAPISFLWRRKRHRFSCLFLNEKHELSRRNSRQIDLRRQCLHSCDLLPCWLRSKLVAWLTSEPTMHQLLLPKLVKVT